MFYHCGPTFSLLSLSTFSLLHFQFKHTHLSSQETMVDLQPLTPPNNGGENNSDTSSSPSSPPLPSPTSHLPHLIHPSPPLQPPSFGGYSINPPLYLNPPFHYFYYTPTYIPYPYSPHHLYPHPYVSGSHPNISSATAHGGPPPIPGEKIRSGFFRRSPKRFFGSRKRVWKPKESTNRGGPLPRPPPPPPPPPPRSRSPVVDMKGCTTVMIKNIPNKIRRGELMKMLDHHCWMQNQKRDHQCVSQYDFLYLPFDFRSKMNVGYAFVNFTSVEGASALNTWWTGKGWHGSPKIRLVTPAKLQGIAKCKMHFKNSMFYCQSEEFLPVEFSPPRDGSNGDTCKSIIIGHWVYGNHVKRTKKIRNRRGVTPPRLSR